MTLCTDAFEELARGEAKALGVPGLPLVIVRHPLGGLSADQVLQRSGEAMDRVIAALTGEAV